MVDTNEPRYPKKRRSWTTPVRVDFDFGARGQIHMLLPNTRVRTLRIINPFTF